MRLLKETLIQRLKELSFQEKDLADIALMKK